jgi:hypothetical protein
LSKNLQYCKLGCIGHVICPTPLPHLRGQGIFKGFRAEDILIRARKIIPFSGWQAELTLMFGFACRSMLTLERLGPGGTLPGLFSSMRNVAL